MGKSETHRDRVYEIAREYIFRKGASGWSMDDLARDGGITKRTLYKMIESKERLAEEIILDFIKGVHERIAAVIAGEKEYFAAAARIMEEFPALVGSMNSLSVREVLVQFPEVEKQVMERRNELTAGVIAFFDRGIRAGHLRKDLTGDFILQLFQAMVLYFVKGSLGDDDFSRQIRAAFKALFYGIRAGDAKKEKKEA